MLAFKDEVGEKTKKALIEISDIERKGTTPFGEQVSVLKERLP